MGIPSGHSGVLVPHEIGQGIYVNPRLTVPGCEAVPEVVKPEIFDSCPLQGPFKTLLDDPLVIRLAVLLAEDEEAFEVWSGYVSQHLLPRLFGFELLTAPYAVAHMKLGLQLAETGYDFKTDERLRVYLTNTLEEAHEMTGLQLFTRWLADEANAAAEVKQEAPVMVVLGNPPYSVPSLNKSFVESIQTNYYPNDDIKEANPKALLDDYVKFIRFGQMRIEQTGYGIRAFITNHGYLDNPTFRRMRQSLMQTFDDIYILELSDRRLPGLP